MGTHVKNDCQRITYTGNSIRCPRRTGERDCRGLRNKSPRGEQTGGKIPLDCTVDSDVTPST